MNIKAIVSGFFANLTETQNQLEPEIKNQNSEIFYCPHCWNNIKPADTTCIVCGEEIQWQSKA